MMSKRMPMILKHYDHGDNENFFLLKKISSLNSCSHFFPHWCHCGIAEKKCGRKKKNFFLINIRILCGKFFFSKKFFFQPKKPSLSLLCVCVCTILAIQIIIQFKNIRILSNSEKLFLTYIFHFDNRT